MGPGSSKQMTNGIILDGRKRKQILYAPYLNKTSWTMLCSVQHLQTEDEVVAMWHSLMGPLSAAIYTDSIAGKDLFVASDPQHPGFIIQSLRGTLQAVPGNCSSISSRQTC